jgi:nitrogen regulatory protein P-II 1
MKSVKATIDALALDDVRTRLREVGATGLTIEEVHEFGRGAGLTVGYRGETFTVDFMPRVALELIVQDSLVSDIVEAIVSTAGAHDAADGEISISTVESAVRIRTGERDEAAVA